MEEKQLRKNLLRFHYGNFTNDALQFFYGPENSSNGVYSSHSEQGKNALISVRWVKMPHMLEKNETIDSVILSEKQHSEILMVVLK